ncbi:MAG TPA: hypothetical protein VGN42_25240 [Pirellulales bacterium]|nr:hypothetical protein [Pirellulales bacterium]
MTLIVVIVIAALIVLANLSDELRPRDAEAAHGIAGFDAAKEPDVDRDLKVFGMWNLSYGWPLTWRQYVLGFSPGPSGVVGRCYSATRLAANLVTWFAMLAAAGLACEWLLRRHRPRLRWSLRTMLAAVGLAAALCGWFAAARNRANLQEPIIAEGRSEIWVDRWGPQWLELIEADHLCRRLVGADLSPAVDGMYVSADQDVEDLLKRLTRLPELRYLFIEVECLTPGMVRALGELRNLRILSIKESGADDGAASSQECLAAVGQMTDLEHLHLEGVTIASESLARLAGLTNLKSLSLYDIPHDVEQRDFDSLPLTPLPALLGLEALANLESLEELAFSGNMVSPAGLESLLALKRLKKLYLGPNDGLPDPTIALMLDDDDTVPELEFDLKGCRQALAALRQSNPGIVIEGVRDARHWPGTRLIPSRCEIIPDWPHHWALQLVREWNERGLPGWPKQAN